MKKGTTKEEVKKRLSKAIAAAPDTDVGKITGDEEGEAWVETQQDLADELEVDRRSIIRWAKEPGAPRKTKGKYNVHLWREWVKDTGKIKGAEAPSPMKYELEVRKLTAVCERLELEQKIKLGQYHTNDDCALWTSRAIGSVRTILLAIPSKMAPAIEMRSKEECERLLRDAIDEALVAIHEKEWPTSKAT